MRRLPLKWWKIGFHAGFLEISFQEHPIGMRYWHAFPINPLRWF
jgi:hypothetical protein